MDQVTSTVTVCTKDASLIQLNTQYKFWETLIEACQDSLKARQAERLELRKEVNTLEASLFPYMQYKLDELQKLNPDVNVNQLVRVCQCPKKLKHDSSLIVPYMNSSMSVFSIYDIDANFIDSIKEHVDKTRAHLRNIKCFKNKIKVMMDVKRKVSELTGGNNVCAVKVCWEDLEGANKRFKRINCELNCYTIMAKQELDMYRHKYKDMKKQLKTLIENIAKMRYLVEHWHEFCFDCKCPEPREKYKHYVSQLKFSHERVQHELNKNKEYTLQVQKLRIEFEELEEQFKEKQYKAMDDLCRCQSNFGDIVSCTCSSCADVKIDC